MFRLVCNVRLTIGGPTDLWFAVSHFTADLSQGDTSGGSVIRGEEALKRYLFYPRSVQKGKFMISAVHF